MKYLSLFSGIGAPEKALDRLGVPYELVGYSEIDKSASRSYAAIHGVSEDMNLGDITRIDEKKLPKDIDLCFYGFPCQDISIAGNQKGLFNEDGTQTRSGLFFEALRIIEETKPRVAIAENVKNLTSKKFAEQFKMVLDSLEAAGYNNYWKVLNAKDFGVPQNRERVFIVSIRKDIDNGTFQFPRGFSLELRLKDVLDDEVDEKFYLSTKEMDYMQRDSLGNYSSRWTYANKADAEKSVCLTANIHRGVPYNVLIENEPRVEKVGKLNSSQDGVVVSPDGIAPCHTSGHGDTPKVLVSEPKVQKVGNIYPSGGENGNIYLETGLSPTLKAGTGVAGNGIGSCNAQKIVTTRGADVASTLRATIYKQGGRNLIENWKNGRGYEGVLEIGNTLRIRKLTPKECFRLMDFDDADYEKAAAVNSNTQLYKQAGNSIVVAVPKFIIAQLLECGALNA